MIATRTELHAAFLENMDDRNRTLWGSELDNFIYAMITNRPITTLEEAIEIGSRSRTTFGPYLPAGFVTQHFCHGCGTQHLISTGVRDGLDCPDCREIDESDDDESINSDDPDDRNESPAYDTDYESESEPSADSD